jgi:hypothetical protein
MKCAVCDAGPLGNTPSRRDTCPSCGADLHSCVQCDFYAPGHYNDCREPQADRVLDREKANFCDFFRPTAGGAARTSSAKDEARAKLDALFRKKR